MKPHLKLNQLEGLPKKLEVGKIYEFQKREPLWFHENINIVLDDIYNNPIAIIKITDFETRIRPKRNFTGITRGYYKVIELYSQNGN